VVLEHQVINDQRLEGLEVAERELDVHFELPRRGENG
jgi:hypothetical protein